MANKRTWREKVDEIEEKIHVITPDWQKRYGKGRLLIPKATDIEKLIRNTRSGQLLTHNCLRGKLAKDRIGKGKKPPRVIDFESSLKKYRI